MVCTFELPVGYTDVERTPFKVDRRTTTYYDDSLDPCICIDGKIRADRIQIINTSQDFIVRVLVSDLGP